MRKNSGSIFSIVMLLTTLACILPATQSASAPPPTPDTRLEIMIAETVSAALTQTQQAPPAIVIEGTTEEAIPPTPMPTNTEVAAVATPSAESVLNFNEDDSRTFIDLLGKYQVTVPSEWLTGRINAPEFDTISLLPQASNPAIQRSLGVIKTQDPNIFRLFALDANEDHIDGGFVTNVTVLWDRQLETSALDQEEIKAIAGRLANSLGDSEVLATEIHATKSGIPYGLIATRTSAITQDGASITVRQNLIFFDTPVGTLNITLSTTEKWLDTIEPSFDEIIESFGLLE
ncbi:MAG: hypothetical protein JNK32_01015 [Anaerolineales bacterium]|nr:hypothetical protein [Anaerolineales bacterium]